MRPYATEEERIAARKLSQAKSRKKYNESHKEERREQNRIWREEHPNYDKEYRMAHKEELLMAQRKRRRKKSLRKAYGLDEY